MVWLSHEPIAGSAAAIERLRGGGHPLVFVTNDPRSTRSELAERLTAIGAPSRAEQILTSASASAEALSRELPGARVLNVGTESLARELERCELAPIAVEAAGTGAAVDVVLVGGGARLDFEVLRIASTAVREGAALWATNKDPTYPTARGLVPGTGAIVAAIEVASGVVARTLGKPEPAMFEAARDRLGCARPLMAGDSLHSDIAGAARAGLATALILTGRDSRGDLDSAPAQPDLIYEDLAALAADLT